MYTSETVAVVTAYIENQTIGKDDVAALIRSVGRAFSDCEEPAEAPREPAVNPRTALKPDHVACLECGEKFKMLKRHLNSEHGLSPDEYRTRWDLPSDYPLTAPNYSKRRADLAKEIGLGRKPMK